MFIRNVLRTSFITQFFFVLICAQYRYDCYEGFCSKNAPPCPELNCKDGRLVKNATKCGCCDICVEQLKEGAKCRTLAVGFLPSEECGPGLMCHKLKHICVPADTDCIQSRIKHDNDEKNGKISVMSRPDCDEFGLYKSTVCISDILCYCVNENGKRIFGMDIARRRDAMNCRCSRDFDGFPKKISQGNFPRCLANGNYDSLQCTEKYCYCMGDSYHIVGTVVQANTTIKDLLCYDRQLHKDDDASLRSKCWHERNTLLTQIQQYKSKNITVIGVDLPECDLDGSYAPVQCRKNLCYCAKKNGDLYKGSKYKIRRNSEAGRKMDCSCIREKELLYNYRYEDKVKQYFEKHSCDFNGNYRQ